MNNAHKIIVSLVLALGVTACGGGGSGGSSTTTSTSGTGSTSTSGSSSVTALQVIDNQVGTGATATVGSTISVNYTGWLYDSTAANDEGTEFGSSSGTPFSFILGAGEVIPGWDQGLVGMQVGGTRTLIIPSALAYGASGNGPIPPNTALVFTVQLLSVTPPQ